MTGSETPTEDASPEAQDTSGDAPESPRPSDTSEAPPASPEATIVFVAQPPVRVPFRAPEAWLPVFTESRPWNQFRLIVPEVEGVEPAIARQVTAECANWLLWGGLTRLQESPDEIRVPGIGRRIRRATPLVEAWRESFFAEPEEVDVPIEPPVDSVEPVSNSPSDTNTDTDADTDTDGDDSASAGGPELPALAPAQPVPLNMDSDGGEPDLELDDPNELPERQKKPFQGYPDDPRPFIAAIAYCLLEDPLDFSGGGGGGGGSEGEGGEDEEESSEGEEGEGEEGEEEGDVELVDLLGDRTDPEDPQTKRDRETLTRLLPNQRHYGTSGQDPSIPTEKLKQLADRFGNDPHWARFLDLIGRISSDAWSPPARVPTAARENIRDLELGDDPSKLIITELLRFGVEDLMGAAYVDFLERRMLQIATEGSEPSGRGPILVAVDMSISMNEKSKIRIPGQAVSLLDLALVLTMGLVRVSDVQKRKVFVVGFSDGIVFQRAIHTPAQCVDAMLYLSSGLGTVGGTHFDPPLEALLEQSKKYPGGDMLFITDGAAHISPPVQDRVMAARRRGLRLFSLLLCKINSTPLRELSDRTVTLTSEKDLLELGSAIAKRPVAKAEQPA